MAQKDIAFTTRLTLDDCADLFKKISRSLVNLNRVPDDVAVLVPGKQPVGFYVPDFSAAEPDEIPDLSIGIDVPKMVGQSKVTPVHIYVQEVGDHRLVEIASMYSGLGILRAERLVQRFFDKFLDADPALARISGNINQ